MSFDLNQPVYTQSQLEAMTKAELLSLASSFGIEGLNDKMLKAEIINSILEVV